MKCNARRISPTFCSPSRIPADIGPLLGVAFGECAAQAAAVLHASICALPTGKMARHEGKEPLLQDGGGTGEEVAIGTPVGESNTRGLIWEGTTWQGCPFLFMPCAPLLCSTWQWKISSSRIDVIHGCCASDEETIDLRRVVDLHFHRNFLQLLVGRGTITIHSASDEFPELRLTTFGTKEIFTRLREVCTGSILGLTTVNMISDVSKSSLSYENRPKIYPILEKTILSAKRRLPG